VVFVDAHVERVSAYPAGNTFVLSRPGGSTIPDFQDVSFMRKPQGFTLTELLAIIAVAALLMAILTTPSTCSMVFRHVLTIAAPASA